ncbi:hypothetical protein [Nostoc sp.]|uniref:hypothetical protein n=1 Tax=Nostoc sp. TaxID=1180 RepID=UPI002FF6A6DA
MKASAVNPINGEVNTFSATGDRNLYSGSSFATNGSLYPEGSLLTGGSNLFAGNNPIPGGGINAFAGDGGSKLQQLIFDRLKLVLGENFFQRTDNTLAGGNNPFLNGGNLIAGGGTNPFAGNSNPIAGAGSLLQQSPFDPLREVLGNNIPFGNSGNTSNAAIISPPFNQGKAPVGNSNRNFGSNNATIGNFNSDYGSNSATIGNGNWNFNQDNATIGNGNWLFASDNTTLGNGNWYWDKGNNNATLGNGNWNFRSNNATIGNGNWDFGNNNTIIGNGNWVFTNGNTIIGNANWLADSDNITIGNINNPSIVGLFPQGIKTDVNNLIDSLIGKIGQNFVGLTGDFDLSSSQTFNRLISSKSVGTNDTNYLKDIGQLLASLSKIQGNVINYQPVQNPQPVPEPASSVPLVVMGLVCLLLSVFKKQQRC